jgi:hypothetical protein
MLAATPLTQCAQTGSDQPIQIAHLALRCLVARVLSFCSEASDTGFVFLIVDPAVARRRRDSALSGHLRPLCAFHHECRISLATCDPLSTLLISE